MTTDEARALRDAIADQIRACPPEAIARLLESDPSENITIQTRAVLVTPAGPVRLALSIQHEQNAPRADGAPIPAGHYADVARKGGAFD